MRNCIIELTDGRHDVRSVESMSEILDEFGEENVERVMWWEHIYEYREWGPRRNRAPVQPGAR